MTLRKAFKMKKHLSFFLRTAVILAIIAGASLTARKIQAADHREAPYIDGVPEGDLTDVYAFTDPNDSSRVVFILGLNSMAAPGQFGSYFLSPDLLYQVKIDNNGDAREDVVIQVTVKGRATNQSVQVFGPAAPIQTGARNVLLPTPTVTGTYNGGVFGSASGVLAFVGTRDDEFVADISQFNRILNGTQDLFREYPSFPLGALRGRSVRADGTSGVDTFAGFDISAIVISVPKTMVRGGGSKINVWGTVSEPVPDRRGGQRVFRQIEREGHQAFATVFVPKPMKDAFNEEIPEHDVANYSSLVPDALTTADNDGTGNTISGRATLLTNLGFATLPNGAPLLLPPSFVNTNKDLLRVALLPDVLRLDLDLPYSNQAIGQFGLQNGRKLEDASIDIPLQLLRQLADVHFPTGVPGGGAIGSRAALECSAFPACQDRRVLEVLQGTMWIKPDSQVTTFNVIGNDRTQLTQFPYLATPHPLTGEPGTIGFPPQQ